MIANPARILLALLLAVWASVWASAADAGRAAAADTDNTATYAAVAEDLRRSAERAFAEKRWKEAVAAYGHLVEHLLDGGFGEASDSIAASRLRIAVAFRNSGDFAAAQTMLTHLAASAPGYEPARTQALLAEVRAALGVPPPPPSAPPVEEPRFEAPLRAGGDVTRPELMFRSDPEYTSAARRSRIQGVVIVEATIDTAGNVTDVKVLKPLPEGLDRAAVEAVKKWKFRPATLHGKPVAVRSHLTVNFRLP